MAKADHKNNITWIPYSVAKARSVAYLGDSEFVEREYFKGLAARQIGCRCERFETPKGYSGSGPVDPNFWREPDDLISRAGGILVINLHWLTIKGDSAKHIDGSAAYGIKIAEHDLVRLNLLPPDDIDDDVDADVDFAKVWVPREARILKRAGELEQVKTQTELAGLLLAVGKKKGLRIAGRDYIRDNLTKWGLWPISEIE